MKRRNLVMQAGAAWLAPHAAHAQSAKVHRVGMLAQDLQPGLLDTVRDELLRLGYREGSSIRIELRNAEGHNERLAGLAAELLSLKVDVIMAVNTPAAQAARNATTTVPIVMMRVADPVKSGLVASLARPGANITGLSFMPDELGPKAVELFTQALPGVSRIGALYQGNNRGAAIIVDEVERKGGQLGLTITRLPVREPQDYASAFDKASRTQVKALFVMDDGALTKHRADILALANRHALPVISIYKDFAGAGGLIAYGPNLEVVYRRAAQYVAKLLKGEPARSLPVEQPTEFYLVVNLRAARTLGLTLPLSLLSRADEVIE
jgi:putative ABC transport system substrate-binding protein